MSKNKNISKAGKVDKYNECPKVYAMYLPQYYQNEHNDKWWGEGYTEWTAVRKAKKLFEGHNQPVEPKDDNYYNLLDVEVMRWQAKLARDYGVDGFIFYHYYFGQKGRMELEKPAENLLKHKDVYMPFCFCWANSSWVRSWSNIRGNNWGEKNEDYTNQGDNGILVKQEYGKEDEWGRHFDYLLPFFKDERYIRIDDKPVFIFYTPSDIYCLRSMIALWNQLADKNGLKGIYYIGNNISYNGVGLDALMVCEPSASMNALRKNDSVEVKNGVTCIDYSAFTKTSTSFSINTKEKTYLTGVCGYDTTPRRGSNGEVLVKNSAEAFKDSMIQLLKKSLYYGNEFVAINAWNEWGEGMHLEPDKNRGLEYLEAVRCAKDIVNNTRVNEKNADVKVEDKVYDDYNNTINKYRYLYTVCSLWIDLKASKELFFGSFLQKNNIQSVAIYGFGDLGQKLYEQLKIEKIKVLYAIDMYKGESVGHLKVYRPQDNLPEVDGVIITAYGSEEIEQMLRKKGTFKVYSVLEVLNELK